MTINPANPWAPVGLLALAHTHLRRYRSMLNAAFSGRSDFRITELTALLGAWNGVVAVGGNVARMRNSERNEVFDAVVDALDEKGLELRLGEQVMPPATAVHERPPPVGRCLDCSVLLYKLHDDALVCDDTCAQRYLHDTDPQNVEAFADELKRRTLE